MSFERIILNNLVFNERFSRRVIPYLKSEWFRDASEKIVFENIRQFVTKYNVPPTIESLAINISNSPIHEGLFDDTMKVVSDLNNDNSNFDWLVEETGKWSQQQAIYNALYQSIDIVEGKDKNLDKNAIPSILSEALATAMDSHIGHDYFDSAEAQWEFQHSEEHKFPFPIDKLNQLTKNGATKKSLNVVLAPINAGKSIFLVQVAAENLLQGKNVLYISMEMSEEAVRERIDCVTMDMTFDQVKSLEKQQYLNRVNQLRSKTSGQLFVKEYPSGGAHTGHFRHLLQELKIKKNFVPDIICIDYLTICASCKLPPTAKSNSNTYFGSVSEEMRAFAIENDLPIYTAVQFDRSVQSGKSSDAEMSNISLAITIAATADLMIAILVPDELRERGQCIGKILKNRYAEFKNTKFIMGLNPSKQVFYDVDEQIIDDDVKEEPQYPNKQPHVDKETGEITGWKF